ncbi:MAG: carboxypeptidase-like regulatory protein, partial [Bacteroidetes bacterium]|nr:carboxypeptidase-like regulatory protein [Bacteroidota bacterium]
NFGGFFLSKVPLIKKLKLNEVGKVSLLTTDGKNTYAELSVGIQRLGFRLSFATGFSNQKQISNGIRVGIEF